MPINYALLDKMEIREENVSLRLLAFVHKSFIFNIFDDNCSLSSILAGANVVCR
jgi:hypothetical protein